MPEWQEQCATLGRGLFELLQSEEHSIVSKNSVSAIATAPHHRDRDVIDDDLGLRMNRTEHDLFVTISTLDHDTHGLYMTAWKWLAERPLPGIERIHLRVETAVEIDI